MTHAAAVTSASNMIRDLADATNTRDDVTLPHAVRNYVNGQPAFWVSTGYHNQAVCNLNWYINARAGIAAGNADRMVDQPHPKPLDVAMLNCVIPLNDAAVMDLVDAYQEAGRTMRRHDLRRRLGRAQLVASQVA